MLRFALRRAPGAPELVTWLRRRYAAGEIGLMSAGLSAWRAEAADLAGVQLEIVEYYQNMWDINRSFDFHSDDMLAELPDMLHDDIEFECNARVIRSIPLFADVAQNPDFVRLLAGELQQIVVMPGGPIVQKGEDGDCMFFLSSGVASVLDDLENVAPPCRPPRTEDP